MPKEYDFELKTEKKARIYVNNFQDQNVLFQIKSPENKLLPLASSFNLVIGNCPVGTGRTGNDNSFFGQNFLLCFCSGSSCGNCRSAFYNINPETTEECKPCFEIEGVECQGGKAIQIKQSFWVYEDHKLNTLASYLCPTGLYYAKIKISDCN